MLQFPRWKIIYVCLVIALGVWLALPNLLSKDMRESLSAIVPSNTLNLGLDLQGGSYLLLEVDVNTYVKEQTDALVDDARARLRKEKVRYRGLGLRDGVVRFQLTGDVSEDQLREMFSDIRRDVDISYNAGAVEIAYNDDMRETMQRNVLEQSIEIVRRRVDETGTREPIIQRQGDDRILLQVPGLQDPEQLKRLLGKTAKMTFHLMDETNPFPGGPVRAKPGYRLVTQEEDNNTVARYLVKKRIALSGDLLVNATVQQDEYGRPAVGFKFNRQGARKFGDITKKNVGKPFAIILDGRVLTAPRIQVPILGGSGIITGSFNPQEATDMALLLRAGALPAPLNILEERSVGPSLGQDSIDAGKSAALIGIALVILLMAMWYKSFGLIADLALIVNMVLVIAVLTLFQATLTLPGIAGLVLTMGMAVDANVLIFERIREEVRVGKSPFAAIDHGFAQAFKTIIDSNFTTLIATFMLFVFGSGPVKGFAVTLSVGILCSMFSAIMFTRMVIVLWARKKRPTALPI